jgi:hypothetical protein
MRARVVAPLVAALLGIAGGTVTALVTDADDDRPDPPAAVQDPLGLKIPLVNLDCEPGTGILVLGFGDTAPSLRAAIADNPAGEPSYLETAESCDTLYGPERQAAPPRYAVFLGPFDGLEEPCVLRMDPVRRGDFVTHLQSENDSSVKCICVLDGAARPDLYVGMPPSDAHAVWIRSLQSMLVDAAEERGEPDAFPPDWRTGVYDQRTADRVTEMQDSSNVASERGVVDAATWGLIAQRLCGGYTF